MTTLVFAKPMKDPTVYISGSGSVELTYKSGESMVYSSDVYAKLGGLAMVTLTPSRGWHIAAVLLDGSPQMIVDEDGFSLMDSLPKNTLSITFLENGGIDDVDTGSNATAFPDPDVGLTFNAVLVDGFAYASISGLRHPEQIGDSWDIQTTATFDPNIILYLVLSLDELPEDVDPYELMLWRTEVVLGDVNLDGVVDGTDESIVANANPSDPGYPEYDLNGDGVVDNEDVEIVAHQIGEVSIWEPLESWTVVEDNLVFIYGVTEHLSVFGVTRIRT
jgi:hypothetical protein